MTKVSNISILPDATQNLVEVYKSRRIQKKFGTLEKQLIGLTVVLAVLFILFFVLFLMAEYYYHKLAKEKLCTSKECLESATTLFQTVDFAQDPCEDFYKFACGKFGVEHPIPENYIQNSWFVEKEDRLGTLILDVLKKPVSDLDLKSVRQTKEFYQSCVNRSELNSLGLKPLFKILEMLELPKNIPSNRTVENFNLGRTLALAQRYLSQDILVSLSLSKGIENATVPNSQNSTILRISPGLNGLNIFDVWKPNYGVFSERKFYKFRRKTDGKENGSNPASGEQKSSKKTVLATVRFIASIIQQINNNLEVDEGMGEDYNASHFVTTAYKIMTFTSQLVKDLDSNDTNAENSTGVEQTTFSTLQTVLDGESKNTLVSNKIDWKEYLTTLFENVNKTYDVDSEPVVVDNLEYFKHMSTVLGEVNPETIQRHIWWKVIEQYAKHTTTEMRAIYNRYYQNLYGESVPPSRSYVCKTLMKDTMNVALSHEMSRIDNFAKTSKKVLEMLEDIEKTFESLVMSISWMDSQTKSITLDKAKSVTKEVGYAKWITDPNKIDEYYEELDLKKSEYLMNIVRISEWEVGRVLNLIGPDTGNSSQKIGWYVNPLQVNAYYSREENTIIIPPGILQTPFYFRGLESLNYGAIGTILGHELTHGFDVEGKNYNKLGKRQENWWPDEIITKYENKAKCFIDQYENYTLYNNTKLNGTLTLAENIADNGGIRESFKAYQLYVARHGQEPRLPGFENFTHEQLLFLSYANIWCEATGAKYYTLPQDSHSPHRVRVIASLQNMKEFSTAYNCSKNSFMNPANKCVICEACDSASTDIELDAKAQQLHRIDSLNLLLYTFLLTLTVLTIWLFKHRRLRFLHETGLAVIYGLIIGALIRYTGTSNSVTHVSVTPQNNTKYNLTVPPDTLWFKFPYKRVNSSATLSKTYSYTFRGEIVDVENSEIDLKATFDPEIFFNIILPPIIFHAGYSLKRRYFFRNLGAILTYALIGTTISSFVVGMLMYGLIQIMPHLKTSFTFLDTLYFGALISSTDPLTILAIFNDLHVDVNLYALVFGESVLNDAVSIVLSGAIQNYGKKYQSNESEFETYAFFRAFGDFIGIFSLSLIIGALMGCITALNIYLTKYTRVRDFPLLESALFVLMSYSTFLIAEVSDLTGVVAVLFCGICQAHYTYNNLSDNSRTRTKHLFQLLNFLAENFIFCYIGVSMFTFPKHRFDPFFIFAGFVCAAIGRAANIYPLSFLLNLGRKPKISTNFQHMLFFAGLRGAMSFALAIRNTLSEARQAMLTTTSLIVIATVIIQGGATMQLLTWFNIPVGVEEEAEAFPYAGVRNVYNSTGTPSGDAGESSSHNVNGKQTSEKAFLARIWGDFDTKYMKPFLTDSRPTLLETLPVCCNPIARLLTTTTQLTQEVRSRSRHDSDSDICLEEELRRNSRSSIPKCGSSISGDLGLASGIVDTVIRLEDSLDGNNI